MYTDAKTPTVPPALNRAKGLETFVMSINVQGDDVRCTNVKQLILIDSRASKGQVRGKPRATRGLGIIFEQTIFN